MLFMDVVVEGAKYEQLEKVVIDNDEEKFFQVGVQLSPQGRQELIEFLRKNIDLFAWSDYEAPGVDPNFICHCLNVNPSTILKRQPPRRSSRDHFDVVRGEVIKLKLARAIKEVFYLE